MHGDVSNGDSGETDFAFGQDYLGGFGGNADKLNAEMAAFHADNAAKHAVSTATQAVQVAHWVQKLWTQNSHLESKVKELEEFRKKILEDMRKLREEHKQLRKKLGSSLGPTNDEEEKERPVPGVRKAHSMPASYLGTQFPLVDIPEESQNDLIVGRSAIRLCP